MARISTIWIAAAAAAGLLGMLAGTAYVASVPAAEAHVPAPARIVTSTADGRPILLARMVVTATPLAR